MEFPKNLTALRKKANLSQDNLAEQLHITRQAVSKWESGASTPDIDTLTRLCDILGTTPNELLTNVGTTTANKPDSKVSAKNLIFIMTSILYFLIFGCGTVLLTVNFFNGVIVEPQITLLALGLMTGAIILFFITAAVHRHRCKK